MQSLHFFIATLLMANDMQQDKLQQADEYFQATLFEQAIPLYEELLILSTEDQQQPIRLRLAQALLAQEKYDAVISLIQGHESPRELLYFLGLAYKRKGEVAFAKQTFERYLNTDQSTRLSFFEEAHYELGQEYLHKKQWPQAEEHFNKIARSSSLYFPAQLYLAKIAILQKAYAKAQQLLAPLVKEEDLRHEIAYLQGQTHYYLQDYSKAVHYFEQAQSLPKQKIQSASWMADNLYLWGWALLKMEQFDRAENVLKQLSVAYPSESATLALAQLYLLKWQKLHDAEAQSKVEEILTSSQPFHSLENEAHGLLLRATAAPTYSQRKNLYQQLTQSKYRETSLYGQGWYFNGVNEYASASTREDKAQAFSSAGDAFRRAYDFLKTQDPALAAQALKYHAETSGQLQNKDVLIQALTSLDLLTQTPSLLSTFKDPGEIFYLKGLIATRLAKEDSKDPHVEMAEWMIRQGLQDYPKSAVADQIQFLLGTFFFNRKRFTEAEKTFLQLPERFPSSKLLGDAWFWAAKSADEQNNSDKAKAYRRKAFEIYPQSTYAAEAYFTYYPYRDYLQGDRPAIKHLQTMTSQFPHSPFLITAYYLIGIDNKRDRKTPEGKWIRKKNMNDAIDALQEAESAFDTLYAEGKIPADDLKYWLKIRYRATLERALANLSIAEEAHGAKKHIFLEYAQEVFGEIVRDFKDPKHPLASLLSVQQAYPHLLEESSYWLAQAYSRAGDDDVAKGILSEMLDRYKAAKITRSYYLSRVWYDLGIIAMHQQAFPLALQYFAAAEDAAKGQTLSTDQRIDLWIQESLCYKAMNDTEKAMLILSKAINDDAISSLRVKAMYLRAELYEQQGRRELAKKQLQATSKKGGEWALKAKEMMEQNYEH